MRKMFSSLFRFIAMFIISLMEINKDRNINSFLSPMFIHRILLNFYKFVSLCGKKVDGYL